MSGLRPLLLILTAMVFALGGFARAAPATGPAESQPPCHEAPAKPGHPAPAPGPGKAMIMSGSCCIGCLPAPERLAPLPAPVAALPGRPFVLTLPRLTGREVPPDPRPPRA
ncbi:MAG: hypothetical protein KF842_15645 [Caulobacter sp.]|nr:hypothetical protein [Caulobacter sp.]